MSVKWSHYLGIFLAHAVGIIGGAGAATFLSGGGGMGIFTIMVMGLGLGGAVVVPAFVAAQLHNKNGVFASYISVALLLQIGASMLFGTLFLGSSFISPLPPLISDIVAFTFKRLFPLWLGISPLLTYFFATRPYRLTRATA